MTVNKDILLLDGYTLCNPCKKAWNRTMKKHRISVCIYIGVVDNRDERLVTNENYEILFGKPRIVEYKNGILFEPKQKNSCYFVLVHREGAGNELQIRCHQGIELRKHYIASGKADNELLFSKQNKRKKRKRK